MQDWRVKIGFKKFNDVLTDVTFFALFCFVAQTDFESVDITGQVTEMTDGHILELCRQVQV